MSLAVPFDPGADGLAALVAGLRAAGCVFAEDEAALLVAAAGSQAELDRLAARRTAGAPLEQVVGWAEFCGLRIEVDPGVFVPRRRTEFLVELAAALIGPGAVVVDLCCGTGAVGAALAARAGPLELHAADIDPAAVACARRNLAPWGGRAYQGDLDAPLPAGLHGRVDLLAANTPYVPSGEIRLLPAEARLHEPRAALDGGGDGLDVQRRVAALAGRWLRPGGALLVEVTGRQAEAAKGIFAAAGLAPEVATSGELEATVVTGTLRAARAS